MTVNRATGPDSGSGGAAAGGRPDHELEQHVGGDLRHRKPGVEAEGVEQAGVEAGTAGERHRRAGVDPACIRSRRRICMAAWRGSCRHVRAGRRGSAAGPRAPGDEPARQGRAERLGHPRRRIPGMGGVVVDDPHRGGRRRGRAPPGRPKQPARAPSGPPRPRRRGAEPAWHRAMRTSPGRLDLLSLKRWLCPSWSWRDLISRLTAARLIACPIRNHAVRGIATAICRGSTTVCPGALGVDASARAGFWLSRLALLHGPSGRTAATVRGRAMRRIRIESSERGTWRPRSARPERRLPDPAWRPAAAHRARGRDPEPRAAGHPGRPHLGAARGTIQVRARPSTRSRAPSPTGSPRTSRRGPVFVALTSVDPGAGLFPVFVLGEVPNPGPDRGRDRHHACRRWRSPAARSASPPPSASSCAAPIPRPDGSGSTSSTTTPSSAAARSAR